MIGLSNSKYKNSNWLKRALQAGIFSGLNLVGYNANATQNEEERNIPVNVAVDVEPDTTLSDSLALPDSLSREKSLEDSLTQAYQDSLAKIAEDSLFNLNAINHFISEVPNLWFTKGYNTKNGYLYFWGVSPKNNPRGLRHPEDTEKAHTAGAILYQLVSSEQIRNFIDYNDLREIGRASLQSIVKKDVDFEVPLDDVYIDTTTFDVKYTGIPDIKKNFIPGSMNRDGTLFILHADAPGQVTTQIVVPKEVHNKIYGKKLKYEELEKQEIIDSLRAEIKLNTQEIIDSLRAEIKLDTVVRNDTLYIPAKIHERDIEAIFDVGNFGGGKGRISGGLSYPLNKKLNLGVLADYILSRGNNINQTYRPIVFRSGNYVEIKEDVKRRTNGYGASLIGSMSLFENKKLRLYLDLTSGLYWDRERLTGTRKGGVYNLLGERLDDPNDPDNSEYINRRNNHKGNFQGTVGLNLENKFDKLGLGLYGGVRGKKKVFGVRGSYKF